MLSLVKFNYVCVPQIKKFNVIQLKMFKVSILVSANHTPGFCQFATYLAEKLHIFGQVKPESDGQYTLEAQGTSMQINDLISGFTHNDLGYTIVLYRLQSLEAPVFNSFKVHENAQTH